MICCANGVARGETDTSHQGAHAARPVQESRRARAHAAAHSHVTTSAKDVKVRRVKTARVAASPRASQRKKRRGQEQTRVSSIGATGVHVRPIRVSIPTDIGEERRARGHDRRAHAMARDGANPCGDQTSAVHWSTRPQHQRQSTNPAPTASTPWPPEPAGTGRC